MRHFHNCDYLRHTASSLASIQPALESGARAGKEHGYKFCPSDRPILENSYKQETHRHVLRLPRFLVPVLSNFRKSRSSASRSGLQALLEGCHESFSGNRGQSEAWQPESGGDF
jgi:hypothetical protein